MALAAAVCPPHHWLIEEHPNGLQHWACCRCGCEREQQQAVPADRPTASWGPRQPRGDADTLD